VSAEQAPAVGVGPAGLVPLPAEGRVYRAERHVRLGDVRPSGRVRLDAVARYLQDVAADDVLDTGFADETRWVVRSTRFEVSRWPAYAESVELATWCSATGPAWAERRTTITIGGVPAIEGMSVWVNLDPVTMRPAPLTANFASTYLASTAGRRIRGRLAHPAAPDEAERTDWALRATDYDVLGHVNNAIAWVVLEDTLSAHGLGGLVGAAEVEYPRPVEEVAALEVRTVVEPGLLQLWAAGPDGRTAISARAELRPSS
jgi:acyl-ACP thioesterase